MAVTETNTKSADAALRDEIEALRTELSTLHEQMRSLGTSAARTARAGVRDAKAHLGDAVDTAKSQGKHVAEALESKVEENPLISLGVAFGVGILIGAILRK